MKLDKNYNANQFEPLIYALWEKNLVFKAKPEIKKERFSMIMPPPNETGTLGVHHVLFLTIQDILARYNRLNNKDVLWLPGTDHAALAVNALIEKQLSTEGLSKHDIGRQAFLERTQEFVANSRGNMLNQMRSIGAGPDWTRLRYTLEDTSVRVVNETFLAMYQKELIYRGDRIVNWDPVLETTVSDDEVTYREEQATLYYLQLGPFEIATVRPETKFGDKYIVINPKDQRYKDYREGQVIEVDWINGQTRLTIIKDEAVDLNFGSGVMTITPWHSLIDYEIAKRHDLTYEQVIDFHGKLLPIAAEFAGQTIAQARPKIIEKLRSKKLIIREDKNYKHQVAVNSRSDAVIEPQIRLQWFVDVNKKVIDWHHQLLSFKEVLQTVVRDHEIDIIPKRFEKTYFNWVDNLRDWCISRQIWWGHRIPVWYRTDMDQKQEIYVGLQPPIDDREGYNEWQQDPDTLDTWFSSALWTFSTLIDPALAENYQLDFQDLLNKSQDFITYHPTSILVTGWDIIFFWVARMILATTFMTGQVPFKSVYLHGLVRSSDGKKMSKSRPESLVDPLDVVKQYGADALRMGIIMGVSPGNDLIYSEERVRSSRNFCNKLWNISRFIENVSDDTIQPDHQFKTKNLVDRWLVVRLNQVQTTVLDYLDHYRFAEAYDLIYKFVWNDYADWYIETAKLNLNQALLKDSLRIILKLIHPFMPFVSESIWQVLFENQGLLAQQVFEPIKINQDYLADAKQFNQVRSLIIEAREVLQKTDSQGVTMYYKKSAIINELNPIIKRLAKLKDCVEVDDGEGWRLINTKFDCWLDIDPASIKKHLVSLKNQFDQYQQDIEKLQSRLDNANYISKAPRQLVDQTKSQLQELLSKREDLKQEITRFSRN